MKIIISRKGLDTGTAKKMGIQNKNSFAPGCSPIYKDSMISLPISDSLEGNNSYDNLSYKGKNLSDIYKELHGIDTFQNNLGAHADPDLIENLKGRENGWKPSFGQASGAQGQLEKKGISKGDLFLFFGLFAHVDTVLNEKVDNFLPLKSQIKPFHSFFGWLQIEQALDAKYISHKPWLDDHPHLAHSKYKDLPKNRIYISAESLSLDSNISGAGHFQKYNENLRLSDPNEDRVSDWLLPKWFLDKDEKFRPEKLGCWTKVGDKASCSSHYKYLPQTKENQVGQWQETVLDTKHFPDAKDWALQIIKTGI